MCLLGPARGWTRAESTTSADVPVRFTRNGNTLYAPLLDTPHEAEIRIRSLRAAADDEVRSLDDDERLKWRQSGDDLVGRVPWVDPLACTAVPSTERLRVRAIVGESSS